MSARAKGRKLESETGNRKRAGARYFSRFFTLAYVRSCFVRFNRGAAAGRTFARTWPLTRTPKNRGKFLMAAWPRWKIKINKDSVRCINTGGRRGRGVLRQWAWTIAKHEIYRVAERKARELARGDEIYGRRTLRIFNLDPIISWLSRSCNQWNYV